MAQQNKDEKEKNKDKLNAKFEGWLRVGVETYEGDEKDGKF